MAMLITNGLVLTFDPDALHGRMIENGAVAVEGGSVAAVGETGDLKKRYPRAAPVLDASGRIVMPGFIVTHTHMPYVRRIGERVVCNPGSLGQPMNGKPDACYAVWEDGAITLRTFPYPFEETIRKVMAMPVEEKIQRELAKVLRKGK